MMAFDLGTALQAAGAIATAFSDPRQSILMSQGIVQRNAQAKARKEQEERQLAELKLRQQRQQLRQAQFQAEQDALAQQAERDAAERQQLMAYMGGGSPSMQPASMNQISTATWTPGQAPPVPSGPGQEAAMVSAAISDRTGSTPFPFAPGQLQLQPAFLSGVGQGRPQTQGKYPEWLKQQVNMVAQTDTEAARKLILDYERQQEERAYKALQPTAMERNVQAYMNMTPEQQAAQRAMRGPGVEINMPGEEPKPESGFVWARGPNRERVPEMWTDPETGEQFQRYKQIPAVTKPPGAEETRGLSLAKAVLDRSDQINTALESWNDPAVRAQYAAAGMPGFGQFFSDTTGGQLKTLFKDIIGNSTYLVSGAEAPPREVQQRIDTYTPNVFDSPENIRRKLKYLTDIARNIQGYRLNKGLDDKAAVPEEAWRAAFAEADANADVVLPVAPDGIPSGYSFSSYDPQTGVYQYRNEDGKIKYWRQ